MGGHWETIDPPPLGLFAREQGRAAYEFVSLLPGRRRLRGLPRGDGHPVLVLPGLFAGDFSTAPLRRFLRQLCYDARGWRLGVNLGPTAQLREKLDARLISLFERHGRRVSLVGWSLGGIYARMLALSHPERVRQVITLATPFRDITATHASRLVPRLPGGRSITGAREIRDYLRQRVPVPATSIYSKSDGIVAWQSCLDEKSSTSENVEVHCSHTGMGWHVEALRVIADRLGQPEGAWRPYRAPGAPGAPGAPARGAAGAEGAPATDAA
jgi:pimeloyl-ACP methyl ester carboxylesterase